MCRIPRSIAQSRWGDERLLVLEDLDAIGFDRRATDMTQGELEACIRWLACFHALFLGERPEGLWDKGTYWHLDTRPDEHAAMRDGTLRKVARQIDEALDASPYQTLVHGDAKPANFCFASDDQVAAVDFQYVGGGCGMKDLAYLIGGCLDSDACFALEEQVLAIYFATFQAAIEAQGSTVDAQAVEADWRRRYPYAWADFERFLQGWSPEHWKLSAYSRHMTERVLKQVPFPSP